MPHYWSRSWGPKAATLAKAIQKIENWPAAVGLRLFQRRPTPRLLVFRDGLNVVCRGCSSDWDVVSELALCGGYAKALSFLRALPGAPVVMDLGANIGVFSLLAARANERAIVHAYEPGPRNFRQFEINRLLNPGLAERIHARCEAVGGETRTAEFYYDENNPQSSGLYGRGQKHSVQMRSFVEALAACGGRVDLVKIDIEGAEFELIEKTPHESWLNVRGVSIEIHDDPGGRFKLDGFLKRMTALGFGRIEKESIGPASYMLRRD